MQRILIVEDDETLARGIRLALQSAEVEITLCGTLEKAAESFHQASFYLLILDINLPDGNGLDWLRGIRRTSAVPVIALTANDMEIDIVNGLESGADDYITKPFSLAVLRARVNAQLRRSFIAKSGAIAIDGFRFDFDRMEFYDRAGRAVELSKTEQKLLRLLVENRGRTLSRAMLVDDRIWSGAAEYVNENALSVTMKRLWGQAGGDTLPAEISENGVYLHEFKRRHLRRCRNAVIALHELEKPAVADFNTAAV